MAQKTVAEQITDLETKIDSLDTKIAAQEALKELEEGGAGSRFRTEFANIDSLYREREKLNSRLTTLYMGQ
jgi:hypothetical protein